jgi:single-stranded-DNA-specific exonuclease
MLGNRNLTSEQVYKLLNPSIDSIEEIQNFHTINEGISLFEEHIKANNKIGIVVDVDVDGYSSAAILYIFLHKYVKHENMEIFIHDNSKEHGLKKDIMDKVLDSGVSLLIVPDAGSEDYQEHKVLNDNNIDVLILDHHHFERNNIIGSNTIIINNQDEAINNKHSSGCTVTYRFIHYFAEINDIDIDIEFLDMVAMSIITDVCDMKEEENRFYYNYGSKISNITNPFLLFFVNKLKKNNDKRLSIQDIGYQIAPLINAAIRIGSYEDRLELFRAFTCNDDDFHSSVYTILNRYKRQQDKEIKEGLKKLNKIIEKNELFYNSIIFIDVSDLVDVNITGLIANKLVGEYKRPVMLAREKESMLEGSFRGYETSVLPSLKEYCEETNLFEWVRGHDNAAGFRINKENMDKFIIKANTKFQTLKFEKHYIVEEGYEDSIPLEDVQAIANYEDLWTSQIECPRYLIIGLIIYTRSITKRSNASYSFKVDGVSYYRAFTSKKWIEDFVHGDFNDRDGYIKANMIVEFRTNKYGYPTVNIVDAKTYLLDEN